MKDVSSWEVAEGSKGSDSGGPPWPEARMGNCTDGESSARTLPCVASQPACGLVGVHRVRRGEYRTDPVLSKADPVRGQHELPQSWSSPCPKPALCCADLHSGHGGGGGVGEAERCARILMVFFSFQ